MTILLVFSVAPIVAVLVSEWARRSVLSTSLFLVAGLASGPLAFGWIALDPRDPLASRVIELTLFLTLFSDGMKIALSERSWRPPIRCLPRRCSVDRRCRSVRDGCSTWRAV